MQMSASSVRAGQSGDHNFTVFTINRPDFLNGYQCQAEFSIRAIKGYLIVENDTFPLPAELTSAGELSLQLVFTDTADEIIVKTSIIRLAIGRSINATDPTDTEFQDSLAQLADSSFAAVNYVGDNLSFYNRTGDVRGQVAIAATGGEGTDLTEIENKLSEALSATSILQTQLSALQAESTAKWVLLNDVDNRSRASATSIMTLEARIAALE